ncbi:MAG: hypothetical protein EP330_13600 [Deltaproteobacteria bacterium]|nr:MAG: hypothetical protein EP330_13600 [Deltaproteobacteria bacterium]
MPVLRPSRLLLLLWPLGLTGCWLTDAELGSKLRVDIDTSEDADPLVLGGIEPAFGPTSGGTEVIIDVGPLTGNPQVQFGSAAGTVLFQTEDQLVVTVPPAVAAGSVPVSISDGGRNIQSADAFTYYEDRSDLVGVLGEMTYITYVGDAWGTQIERPADFGYGWVSFIEPQDVSIAELSYGTTLDTCSSNYTYTGTLYDRPVNAASLTMNSGSTVLDFQYSAQNLEFSRDLTIAEFRPGSVFDLHPLPSSTFPSYGVEGFAKTPLPFQVTQPEFDTFITDDFTVTWSSDERGDYMLIRMDLYSDLAGGFVETVKCLVADDGEFFVSGSNFSTWTPIDTTLRLGVARVIDSDAVLAHDNSEVGVVGMYWVFGLAYADL